MSKYAILLSLIMLNASARNNFIITEEHQYAANKYRSIGVVSFPVEDQQIEACRQEFCDKLIRAIADDNRGFDVRTMALAKERFPKQQALDVAKGITLQAVLPEESGLWKGEFKPELLCIIADFKRDEGIAQGADPGKEQMTFTVSCILWDNRDGHLVAYGITGDSLEKSKGGYNAKKVTKTLLSLAEAVLGNFSFLKNK